MKALLIAGTVIVALLWVAFIGVVAGAIWTAGALSNHLTGTAILMFAVSVAATFAWVVVADAAGMS